MKQKSPLLRILELGESEHGRLKGVILSALVGVLGGIIPYIAAAQIIIGMMQDKQELGYYIICYGIGLAGYLARTLLNNLALALSHQAAFSIYRIFVEGCWKSYPNCL